MTPTRVRGGNRKNGKAKMAFLIDCVQPRQMWMKENKSAPLVKNVASKRNIKNLEKIARNRLCK